ncbi:hypothetical protein PSV08DRAFT_250472 [Bipolaris maydis]|nr:hypothetical protein J3E74DRAFT_295578 [Bipolaris maydis]KAJ6267292.1 hypothetical protein PSV08DRAFT_250472 [Bipolaris maydis]
MAYASSWNEHPDDGRSASGNKDVAQHQSEFIALKEIPMRQQDDARQAYLEDLGYGWRNESIKEPKMQCICLWERLQAAQIELLQHKVYDMERSVELEDNIYRLQRQIVTHENSGKTPQQNEVYVSRHAGIVVDGASARHKKRKRSGSIDDTFMPDRKRVRYK